MTSRREFVVAAGAAAMLAAYGHARVQDTPRWRVIDGMGEVHFDYEPALIDASRFLINSLKPEAPLTLVTNWPRALSK